ncbi:NAD(P)/FAD-dependent oxidoreductase [Streptomyces sp. NPDC007084]|uniref:NAD(P)/FAD-dependent oxidoreductase n=1 Tax=Streptomyces sp. NPDC007084 TaxID=3154313 RepID=UPI003453E696
METKRSYSAPAEQVKGNYLFTRTGVAGDYEGSESRRRRGVEVADVVVIGSGSAALAATLSLARMNIDVMVVSAGNRRNEVSESMHGYLGHDGASPGSFYSSALDQLTRYPTVSIRSAEITGADGTLDRFVARSADAEFSARRLLVATGVEDLLPAIDGLAGQWGTGVLHCVYCHGWEVRGRSVAVLASDGRLPVGVAMRLAWLGCEVTLFTDSDEPIAPHTAKALRALEIATRSGRIVSVTAARGTQLVHTAAGSHPVDVTFVQPVPRPRAELAVSLGCELTSDGRVKVDAQGRTTVTGVYAAGDVARVDDHPPAGNVTAAATAGYHTGIAVFNDIWDADTQRRINQDG